MLLFQVSMNSFIKPIVSQFNIAMNLHYDSLSYLDHTCRTSIRQHIRRYRSRYLGNTHRTRCSGHCISDHSICQTNQVYINHLNEVSNTITKKNHYLHNLEFENCQKNSAKNKNKIGLRGWRTFRTSCYIIKIWCTNTGAVQWMAIICRATRKIASYTRCAVITGKTS